MNIKKLIVLVGDEAESASKVLSQFVIPETIGKQAIDAALEVAKTLPMQVKEHHVRHFFTKINRGNHAVGGWIGKNLETEEQVLDYFVNAVARSAYGHDFPVRHFAKDFEYYKNGVYSCAASSDQAAFLKREFGKDVIVVYVSKDPAGEEGFDFEVIANNKTKLKKDLISILETLKERWM